MRATLPTYFRSILGILFLLSAIVPTRSAQILGSPPDATPRRCIGTLPVGPSGMPGSGDTLIIPQGCVTTLDGDLWLPDGAVLIVERGATLLIPASTCLESHGTLINDGTIRNSGHLVNHGLVRNTSLIVNQGGSIDTRGRFVHAPGAMIANRDGGRFTQLPAGPDGVASVLTDGIALPQQPPSIPATPIAARDRSDDADPDIEAEAIEEQAQEIEERVRYDFDQLKDPKTGLIPRHIRQREYEFAKDLPVHEARRGKGPFIQTANTYSQLGPNNLGGRTRAIAFDKTNASVMLAGCVSSGIFRSVNGGTTWTNVTQAGQVHNITAIAQDPRSGSESTWYYGTGEALGNSAGATSAFYLGQGIFKSTDNGLTWTQLSLTSSTLESFDSPFDIVHRIAVDPTNGYVYAAAQRVIERSTDGGTTWSPVLGELGGSTSSGVTDIVITDGGRLYASFAGTAGTNSGSGLPAGTDMEGVWTSTSGAAGTWTRIAGGGAPTGWNATGAYGRVVLAFAPSNQNILYAMYYTSNSPNCPSASVEADFFKYDQSITTWYDRSANLPNETGCLSGNDPFAVQGGYDLVIAVKPDDPDFVVIGGTNAYRSTNGFATTGATTRIGGYATASSYALYANHHPDVHALVFSPSSSSVLVSGDDGGIQETSDITAGTVAWTSINNDYVTYQYYYVALDPTIGSLNCIGGAQDNGTTASTGSTTFSPIWSGDGVSVGISDNNTYQYVGSQNGSISRRFSGDANGVGTSIQPNTASGGLFVTYFLLNPDNTEQLWYASSNKLYRTTAASTVTTNSWTTMTGVGLAVSGNITALATSRGIYTTSHRLYIGSSSGQLLRLNDPANAVAGASPTAITGGWSGNVIWIAVDPTDDKKVMVTLSNYGVTSIYYTSDASVASPTWTAVEGNLTLPSVRCCAIVPRNGYPTEYYVGTSVGLYSTDNLNGASTVWSQEGASTIGRAVVRSLAYRPIDNRLLIGTHGDGMFYADIPDPAQLPREWRGKTSTAWATTTNWNHGAVPSGSDDALLPSSGVTNEASITTAAAVNNLTIQSGRTVTVSNTGSLTVNGNLSSAGTLAINGTLTPAATTIVSGAGTLNGSGTVKVTRSGSPSDDFADQFTIATKTISGLTVEFNGASAQNSATSPFGGLKINNGAGVSLQAATGVNGTLTLTNGLLNLGGSHLTLAATSTIGGTPTASAMVVPTGAGELRKTFTGAGSFTYPVGDNTGTPEYSPVTLNFTSGTFSSAYAGVKLVNAKHPNSTAVSDYLTRYWTVSQSGISSFSCAATFTYADGDIVGTESNLFLGKYDAPTWTKLNAANASLNQLTGTVANFSDFTGSDAGALPVELVLFTASLRGAHVTLRWKTATEQDNVGFAVERSRDGVRWEERGFVAGHGTVNTPQVYQSEDELPLAEDAPHGWQYRLRQIDRDGRQTYSPVVTVNPTAASASMTLLPAYPNPLHGGASGTITFNLPYAQPVRLTLYDLRGAVVARLFASSALDAGQHAVPLDASRLVSGTYICELRGESGVDRTTLRIIR
jgi:hypothetical protein